MGNNSQGEDKKLKKLMLGFFIALIISLCVIVCCIFLPWIHSFTINSDFSAVIDKLCLSQDEIVLSKDPFKSPSLFIIEEPTLKLSRFAVKEHSIIPPMYEGYPNNVSASVKEYLEKRNQYILEFTEKYLYIDEEHEEALHPPFDSCREIDEIIPFTYKNIDSVYIVSDKMARLNSCMEVIEIEHNHLFQMGVSASANFTDRFWHLYAQAGATGGHIYYDVIDENYFTDKKTLWLGGNYDFDPPPSIMKIVIVHTNPTMEYYFKSPYIDYINIFSPEYRARNFYEVFLQITYSISLFIFLISLGALFILMLVFLNKLLLKLVCFKKEK